MVGRRCGAPRLFDCLFSEGTLYRPAAFCNVLFNRPDVKLSQRSCIFELCSVADE